MGWCSGTVVFDAVCDAILSNKKIDKQELLEQFISVLHDMDWDCEQESEYFNHPTVKKAFTRLGYGYYYEDDNDSDDIDISDVCVVMTGFRDAELRDAIEYAGGRVTSSVSSKTTHLLIAGKSAQDGSTKMEKARQLGVKIMTPAEFKKNYVIE